MLVLAILWYKNQQCTCSSFGDSEAYAYRILEYASTFLIGPKLQRRRKWIERRKAKGKKVESALAEGNADK